MANNPNGATLHQIIRLMNHYLDEGNEMGEKIDRMLNPKPEDISDFIVVKSDNINT